MSLHRYTAAVIQQAPVYLDRDATLDRLESLTGEAAANGAKLAAFSEAFISGYPAWVFGGAALSGRTGKRLYRKLVESALEIPSPELTRIQETAARHRIALVVGANERNVESSGTSIFNSLVFIDENGTLLGVHRKIMPTSAERKVWSYGDARGLRVHGTSVGRLGGLLCYEHWMPLPRFALHAGGEEVHVAAWPDMPEAHHIAARHYALEGRAYVLCVGQFLRMVDLEGDEEMCEAFLAGAADPDERDDVVFPAGSGIIGPDGNWIAGPTQAEPIIYGQIDLDRVVEEREFLDTGGHYARPDIFSVTVDRRPRSMIDFKEGDETPKDLTSVSPADP